MSEEKKITPESIPEEKIIEGETIYQSSLNDFHIIDAGPGLITTIVTVPDGILRSRYPTSEVMSPQARALYKATNISIKDLSEMDMEDVKEVLRKRNPKK